jgi:hypothetical protein
MGNSQLNLEAESAADAIAVGFVQSGESLSVWAARHPEQGRTLARLALETRGLYQAAEPSEQSVRRVRELGQQALAAHRPALKSLLLAAEAQGLAPEDAAQALSLPYGLFVKLHRRLIAFESIPASLLETLARSLRRTGEELAAYLSQPPTLATGASYRADEAPEALVESFAAALAADPETTDAMRHTWEGAV